MLWAMSSPLISVSGTRGIVDDSFTPQIVREWTSGFAGFCDRENEGCRVVIGRDTRPSGAWALRLAAAELARRGIQPITLGIVPTPTVQLAVREHGARGGLIITASHNPKEWNGLKFLGSDGVFLSAEEIEQLTQYVSASEAPRTRGTAKQSPQSDGAASPSTPSEEPGPRNDTAAIERHIENILSLPVDVEQIRARKFRVVLDPVNGTGALAVPPLLRRLGCTATMINGEPTGDFAHAPEPTPASLIGLGEAVRATRANLGVAVDPDADRLVLVDESGTVLSEEYTVTLAVCSVIASEAKQSPEAEGSPSEPAAPRNDMRVVVNLSTTRMVDDVARQFGASVIRTPVGERHVVEGMRQHGALIGGEGSGGVIFTKSHEGRDSLVGIALVLDLLAKRNLPLSALVSALPHYVMSKEKLPRMEAFDSTAMAARLTRHFQGAQCSTIDGIRIDTPDGWVHLRPSNTEPVIRLIAEARTEALLDQLRTTVHAALAVLVR